MLTSQVELNPDKLLYAWLNLHGKITQSYSNKEFTQRVNDVASYIHKSHRIAPGERVLLAYPPGLEIIAAFFACVKLGLIPVPVYPPSSKGFRAALYKMTFIAKDCGATAMLTDRSFYWSLQLNLKKTQLTTLNFRTESISKLKWIVTDDVPLNSATEVPNNHSDILFLQYTSGSTNNPKGVMVTHNNIIHNCNMVVDHLPVGVSWLPQYHDMGLIGYYLFFALKGGTTYGFSPLDFIERPALWLETISKYKGTASSAPNFAYEYCLRPDKIPVETFHDLDLSSLRFLMTAAEPVRTKTYLEFLRTFEPYGLNPASFFSAYGLAEFTLAVSNYGKTVNQKFVSCGKPLGDTVVKIVDTGKTAKEVKDGGVGEIWVDGSSKCNGYWNRPALTKDIFEATGEGSLANRSWLRTGDLGFIHEGELYVCGRSKDLIIIRGQNYYPNDIETIVESEPGIRKGCTAAFPVEQDDRERLIVVAEVKDRNKLPAPSAINKKIFQALGIGIDEIIYTTAHTIPKTSSGKLIRHQTKTLYLEGKLKQLARSVISEKHIEEKHNNADPSLAALFNKYGIAGSETETLTDMGLDSLKLASFVHDLKQHLKLKGYADLLDLVEARLVMRITVSELFGILQQMDDVSLQFRFTFKQAFSGLRAQHLKQEQRMMAADAMPRSRTNGVPNHHQTYGVGHILLTGGTGFFGPFLLKSLLEQNADDIYVMVRANDDVSGTERVLQAMQYLDPDACLLNAFNKRVKIVCGDLSSTRFGLDAGTWRFLAENIHTIYHNGAHVNYLFDYESMRHANVGGTNEVVSLALEGRQKTLNHISTTFIFGWSIKETLFESDNNETMELLDFGYSQSKWVSEQVVKRAMDKGLRARIFRPALLSPSINGGGINLDISIRLLAFMLKHCIGTSAKNQVSFTPADLAANNIVAISNVDESIGNTFHVTRDEYSSMADVTNILGNLTGNEFRIFSLKDFVPEVVSRCRKDDPLFPLLDFLVRSADNISSMEFKRYDNSNYRKYRGMAAWGKEDPSLEDVVSGILKFMKKQALVAYTPKPMLNA